MSSSSLFPVDSGLDWVGEETMDLPFDFSDMHKEEDEIESENEERQLGVFAPSWFIGWPYEVYVARFIPLPQTSWKQRIAAAIAAEEFKKAVRVCLGLKPLLAKL